MFIKKLLTDSLIYAIGPQIPKIASLFILPIITKFLGPSDYGIAGILFSYIALLSALYDLGFSVLMMNSFYNYPKKWNIKWKQYHFYLSIWAIIYGVILSVLLYLIMPNDAEENTFNIILLVVLPVIFFNVTTNIATKYYQFSRKPIYVSIVSAGVGILSILLNLITIAYMKMAYMGWFISLFISSLVTFLCYFYPLYIKYKIIPIIRFNKQFLLSNLKISLPLIPHNYSAYLLNSADRMVMERLHIRTSEIGNYSLAYTFGSYMEFFGGAIGMAIGPVYTKLFADKSNDAAEFAHFLTHWLQISFILISFIVALWCRELFLLLISNSELQTVYPLAIIIIMGYAYRPYYWTCITRLQYSEKTKELWKISFLAGIINIVLNLIFIPIYGVFAAGVITYISLLYIGFAGYFLKSFRKIETQKYNPIIFVLIITFSTILVYVVKDIQIYWKVIFTLILCVAYCIYIYIIRKKFLQYSF